jgi:SAM-dependent methyltransferase
MKKTDWTEYYKKQYKVTSLTRKISERILINLMKKYSSNKELTIIELGGANSCFYKGIRKNLRVKEYTIIDNNEFGLEKTKQSFGDDKTLKMFNQDVLDIKFQEKTDIVFSVGLIEHFSESDIETVIQNHYNLLQVGGICIITYPTPTFLYKITRAILEALKLWRFYDETPLKKEQILKAIKNDVRILYYRRNDYILLSQGIIVMTKIDVEYEKEQFFI